ncbi:MAG: 30S ribosomal protein S8 [Patescibacteria group bacterium]
MVKDTLSDYISNIKNAAASQKELVTLPYSNLLMAVTDLLEKEGYVKNATKKGKKGIRSVEIKLVYTGNLARMHGAERISKPSKRIYAGATDLPRVKNGFGTLVVSTSKGVMTDVQARKDGLGGELLFKIW